jgi:hypothetical protein
MNPYALIGARLGTNEAASLAARLSAWHDAMVAHERRLRSGRATDSCDDECPHADARTLWSDAVATFGPRAHELVFLRSRAKPTSGDALEWPRGGRRVEERRGTRVREPAAAGA